MGNTDFSNKSLSLDDEEFPVMWDRLLISKEQAANLTDEQLRDLMQKWGEGLDVTISQEPKRDPSGYIYLAKGTKMDGEPLYEGEPLYKIGRSNKPEDRVRALDTQAPVKVEIVNHFPTDDSDLAENILHDQHEAVHVRGEWYALDAFDLARLANATGFEDGELTFTSDALRRYMKDAGEVMVRDDRLLDGMAEDLSSLALFRYIRFFTLEGPDELAHKLVERAAAKKRLEALARLFYWGRIKMRSSPPEEWDIPPEEVVQDVLSVLHYHPDVDPHDTDDDRMESIADVVVRRCLAATEGTSKGMLDILNDVMADDREVNKLMSILMVHHPKTDARFVERDDESEG